MNVLLLLKQIAFKSVIICVKKLDFQANAFAPKANALTTKVKPFSSKHMLLLKNFYLVAFTHDLLHKVFWYPSLGTSLRTILHLVLGILHLRLFT